jgi:uncharacterized protein YjiS (DUF1127 family)
VGTDPPLTPGSRRVRNCVVPVPRRGGRIWRILRVSSRSYSTTPWSETTIEDRCSIAIPALITSIVRRYQAWRRYETVRRELSHQTDRELADIGITRSDIERIASGKRIANWQLSKPSMHNAHVPNVVGLRCSAQGIS